MKFSERIGKTEIRAEIQLNSIDEDLKNGLWNIVSFFITEPLKKGYDLKNSSLKSFIESLWFSLFKEPIDEIPQYCNSIQIELKKRFFSWNFLDQYDFIDFIGSYTEGPFDNAEFIEGCNFVLKRELSGYRFVNEILVPITDEREIFEVEKAISEAGENKFIGVQIHLTEALNKLADRVNPDYRNSIKESISAVESICQQITGDSNAELGKALKQLKQILPIHGALEKGFKNLYGYTSDSDGIRHAMMEDSHLDQEDALYMLISCSSFVNYLTAKANKLDILNDK